jgi:hypothetical protein
MSSQIDTTLIEAPKGRPSYFMLRKIPCRLQPKVLAKPSMFKTLPTEINFELVKLILRPKPASKHKNKLHKLQR